MISAPEKNAFDRQDFSTFIAGKRRAAGMTQEELAQNLYVTHSTVSKWERGGYPARILPWCRRSAGNWAYLSMNFFRL